MDVDDLTTRYIDAWNQTDPQRRAQQVDALFGAEARYVDPLAEVTGTRDIAGLIGEVQTRFAGSEFRLVGRPDGHHRQLRFSWELGPAGQTPAPVAGSDVAMLDDEDRIVLVLGFLDRVPS